MDFASFLIENTTPNTFQTMNHHFDRVMHHAAAADEATAANDMDKAHHHIQKMDSHLADHKHAAHQHTNARNHAQVERRLGAALNGNQYTPGSHTYAAADQMRSTHGTAEHYYGGGWSSSSC